MRQLQSKISAVSIFYKQRRDKTAPPSSMREISINRLLVLGKDDRDLKPSETC